MSDTTILLPYLGRWDQFRKSRFHQIAERLANRDFEIHVIQAPATESDEVTFRTREIDPPEGIVLHEAAVNQRMWHSRFANKVFQKGYYGLGVREQINQLVETHSVDVLWLYNLPHYFLARIADVPVVFDYVDDYVAMLESELPIPENRAFKTITHYFFADILRQSDLIFSISHELKQNVTRMIGDETPCVVLPNGVDDDVFPVTSSVESPTLHDPPTVGFVGAFEYFIDFDLILDAAEALPEVQFLLVGDGREYERVARAKEHRGLDNIKLTGLVESQNVPAHIEQMDICLNTFQRIPLAHSAVPLKLFEYLSMNRPVISTRIREVQTLDTGYLYYADTGAELVARIHTILDNYPRAVERTAPAKQAVERTYNWDVIAETFTHTLHEYELLDAPTSSVEAR